MNEEEKDKIIRDLINNSLDNAEKHWNNGGYKLVMGLESFTANDSAMMESVSKTRIPGHPEVSDTDTIIDDFIALVVDMRDSTNHLMVAISQKKSKVTGLQRVFYETSALLPALERAIQFEGGSTTEYLGDGVLAFFKVDEKNRNEIIKKSRRAAVYCISNVRNILNDVLNQRYGLPKIDIGIGLAISKAIVSNIGIKNNRHPKAFGECVFRATKISDGRNEICVDTYLRKTWPTSKGGSLKFIEKNKNNFKYYKIA